MITWVSWAPWWLYFSRFTLSLSGWPKMAYKSYQLLPNAASHNTVERENWKHRGQSAWEASFCNGTRRPRKVNQRALNHRSRQLTVSQYFFTSWATLPHCWILSLWPGLKDTLKRDQTTFGSFFVCVDLLGADTFGEKTQHFRNTRSRDTWCYLAMRCYEEWKLENLAETKAKQKKKRIRNQRDYSKIWVDKEDWHHM